MWILMRYNYNLLSKVLMHEAEKKTVESDKSWANKTLSICETRAYISLLSPSSILVTLYILSHNWLRIHRRCWLIFKWVRGRNTRLFPFHFANCTPIGGERRVSLSISILFFLHLVLLFNRLLVSASPQQTLMAKFEQFHFCRKFFPYKNFHRAVAMLFFFPDAIFFALNSAQHDQENPTH